MAEEQEEMSEEKAKEVVREFAEARETTTGFFTRVVKNPDTTKTGNVSIEELGTSNLPVRTLKELALLHSEVFKRKVYANYYNKMAENQLATSLSKDGFLLKLVGTTRKEVADLTPTKQVNKGWFKGKKNQDNNQNT